MNGVELVASWFTPAVLFCVLNLMIGAIFITSKSIKPHRSKPQSSDEHPPQLGRIPSIFERVRSFKLSRNQPEQPDPTHYATPPQQQQVSHDQEDSEEEREEPQHHVTRTRSQPVAVAKAKAAPPKRVLKKSVSEKIVLSGKREEEVEVDQRRPATVREKTAAQSGEDDAAVDGKADDFINMFRQQLKLQRLDSILRYKEMLTRGAAR